MLAQNKKTIPHKGHRYEVRRAKPDSIHYGYYYCVDCGEFLTWIDRLTYNREQQIQKNNGIMWFGQYQGAPLTEIPTEYLQWCIANLQYQNMELLHQELARRTQ